MSCCSVVVLLRVGKSGMGTKPFSSASFFCERACLLDELQRMSIRVPNDYARSRVWHRHYMRRHELSLSFAKFSREFLHAVRYQDNARRFQSLALPASPNGKASTCKVPNSLGSAVACKLTDEGEVLILSRVSLIFARFSLDFAKRTCSFCFAAS